MPKGMHAIYSRTWTSPADGIAFNNIPQIYDDLLILISARSSAAGNADGLGLWFNGLQSPVSNTSLFGNGSSAGSARSTYRSVGSMPGSNLTANVFGSCQIYIPNYRSSIFKQVLVDNVIENNATFSEMQLTSHLFLSSAPITSFFFNSSTFGVNQVAGTTMSLYGIGR